MTTEPTPAEEAQSEFNTLLNDSIPTPPGVEDELAALLEQRFPQSAPDEVPGPSDEQVEPVEASEPAPEVSTPPPVESPSLPDHLVLDDGTIVSREEATAYAAFEKFLSENPAVAQSINDTINRQIQPSPPPENVDLEDPTVQYLLAQNEAVRQQLAQAQELIQRHDYQLNTQTEVSSAAIVEQGVKHFQSAHALNDNDIQTIRQQAATLGILPGLIQSGMSPNDAVQKSLDIAYWSIEDYRNRETQRQYDANRADQEKKSKLASLGGASGAISREPPAPTTKEEIRSAMIREVAEHMGVPPS